jgi:hypothetical protein
VIDKAGRQPHRLMDECRNQTLLLWAVLLLTKHLGWRLWHVLHCFCLPHICFCLQLVRTMISCGPDVV